MSAVLGAAFLALVPVRRSACTALGTVTLYPFLLHGLFLQGLAGTGVYGAVRAGGPAGFAALTFCAAALAVLLGAPAVRRVLRPLVEPRLPIFLTPPGATRGAVR